MHEKNLPRERKNQEKMSWQDWQDEDDERLLVTDEVEMEINVATKVIGKIKIGLFGKGRVR